MKLNRGLIKQQAQQIIKGNIFKLFFITLIIGIITSGGAVLNLALTDSYDFINDIPSISDYSEDEIIPDDPWDRGYFDDFDGNGKINLRLVFGLNDYKSVLRGFAGIWQFASLVLLPLNVMLMGVYWELIKGNNLKLGDAFTYIFTKTFDKNYINKFLLNILQGLFTFLWALLFYIPGIVYMYKMYFTLFILAEKPELSWREAMNISKKMTQGHKGELFVLDLSFIPWYLLMIVTLGIAGIYVGPYVNTVQALYYENFKIRAFNEGALQKGDYMTQAEKAEEFFKNNQHSAQYYQPEQNQYNSQTNYYNAEAPQYYAPPQPVQPVQQTVEPVQPEPVQPETPTAPEIETPSEPTDDNTE